MVFDTNVVVSALLFGGGAGSLRRASLGHAFQPLVSAATTMELIRVLAYPKFRLSRAEQQELLADCLPDAATVIVRQPPPKVPVCRDRFDLPVPQLARVDASLAL